MSYCSGAAEKWGLAGVLHTVLTNIPSFCRSTRALTQAEPHLAVAPEQLPQWTRNMYVKNQDLTACMQMC